MLREILSTSLILAAAAVANVQPAEAEDATTFTVTIENVSTANTLRSMSGGAAPAPNSPGLWVVHRESAPLFKVGKNDLGWGLEAQAEDGNPERLAEHCQSHKGVVATGIFNIPEGDTEPGPALPGKKYVFRFTASPGSRLSFATMFGQSNDLFYAPPEAGIALFDGKGRPLEGDITSRLELWDAGTEVNQEPGFGADQAPRQKAPNTGAPEKKSLRRVKDGFKYPRTAAVLRVTIAASEAMAQH